jgi:hypothetical protein
MAMVAEFLVKILYQRCGRCLSCLYRKRTAEGVFCVSCRKQLSLRNGWGGDIQERKN